MVVMAASGSVCRDEPARLFVPRRGHEERTGRQAPAARDKWRGLVSRAAGPGQIQPGGLWRVLNVLGFDRLLPVDPSVGSHQLSDLSSSPHS